jgi:sulfane dehydrogenase subunit SoxC
MSDHSKTDDTKNAPPPSPSMSRRGLLSISGAGAMAMLLPRDAAAAQPAPATAPNALGDPRRAYGERSPFETAVRSFNPNSLTPATSASFTPLQALYGIITPSALHFERHHSGVPAIDPARHELLIHGLVTRPLIFDMEALRRLPSTTRIHFIECAGNSGREHAGRPGGDPSKSHGLISCSEWTGVPLAVLLKEAGLKREARWVVAEGADPARHARSLPLEKALDDVLVAYGQNGEALRPEQGYPLRLVVPGWEGNINVKWLHRLHVVDQPAMTRDEASSYTDLMPDGKARWFSFVMEAKSVITRPAGGQKLPGPGFHEISGLAWSGRGRIRKVEISMNGGASWETARLDEPILPKAFTRFHLPWRWSGGETTLRSRCTDETGYVQPTREELVSARGMKAGPDGYNHYNGIKVWKVQSDGTVTHV